MADLRILRICFVPTCPNTSLSTPQKVFLDIPQDRAIRDKWFRAVGRYNQGLTSNYFCCEDHFDLKEDLEIKGENIMIKDNLIPRIRSHRKQSVAHLRSQILLRRHQEIDKLRKKISDSSHNDNNCDDIKQDMQDKGDPSSPVPSTSKLFDSPKINTSKESCSELPIICEKVPRAPAHSTSIPLNSRRHFKRSYYNLYRLRMLREKKRIQFEEERINTLKALVLAISLSNNTVVEAINGLRQDLVQIRDLLANRYWAVRN